MILHNKIKKIINAIKDSDINEIEISSYWGAQKIRLTKNNNSKVPTSNANIDKTNSSVNEQVINIQEESEKNVNEIEVATSVDNDTSNLTTITAPLVGTFYSSAKPSEPPFINKGDTINQGQSICIIEAMKIFNEIESEFNGKIIDILISDGEPVEYGQPLFTLKEE